uniref:Uncharacterized protein n=1 Tax=Oryza meridionalis TaxID=40149 RepID=A0A0E0C7K4_9ORYZ
MGCGDLIPPPVVPQQIAADGSVAYMGAIMAPVQEQDKQLVVDLAPTAADQLARMCSAGEPLWVRIAWRGGDGRGGARADVQM